MLLLLHQRNALSLEHDDGLSTCMMHLKVLRFFVINAASIIIASYVASIENMPMLKPVLVV